MTVFSFLQAAVPKRLESVGEGGEKDGMCANLCNHNANDLGGSEKGTEAAVACETEEGTETQSGSGSAIGGVSVTRFGQQRERPYQFLGWEDASSSDQTGTNKCCGIIRKKWHSRLQRWGERRGFYSKARRPCRSTELLTRLLNSR
jgi:hypothetical protein